MGSIHPSLAFDPEAPVRGFDESFPRFREDPHDASEMFASECGDPDDLRAGPEFWRSLSEEELIETRKRVLAGMSTFTGDSSSPTPLGGFPSRSFYSGWHSRDYSGPRLY